MIRREFITLLGGTAAWPIVACAQQPMPVVGFLKSSNSAASGTNVTAFRQGLAETGFVEGRNLAIEYRWAQGRLDRLPELASDLIRRRVALIATPGDTPAARAVKAATATIPIVFSVASDPVALGLVSSLNRPGGNATGFAEINTDLASKRLEILHELVPGAVRFAILVDSNTSPAPTMVASLQAAAAAKGWQLESLSVAPTAEDIEVVFTTLAQKRIDAVLVSPGAPFFLLRSQLAELAARHAIPTIYWDRQLVETGGLVSYGSNITDQFRQVGIYAGRILKGAKPADLPVQQPTKFELVINLKTAKALGLEVPPMLLARADEVIEQVRQHKAGAIQPVKVRPKLRSSVRLVASVAWPLATVVAKRTQRLHGVWD